MITKAELQELKDKCIIPVLECPDCGETLFVHPFRLPDNEYRLYCGECMDYKDEKDVT